jgi:riboflavin synthase
MFTGIIEEIGVVTEFRQGKNDALVVVECQKVLEDSKLGDSIAINGVCQTVIDLKQNSFSAQVSNETLKVTTFSNLKTGEKVNLERALTLASRLGGHMVTGHIDDRAKVLKIEKHSDFYTLTFKVEKELTKYIVNKGSICINGISLTVAKIVSDEVEIAIIPHTFENTNLKAIKAGDYVNMEVDILAKYVEKNLSTGNNTVGIKSNINDAFLAENGFF